MNTDDEFFSVYSKAHKKTPGIPNIQMNMPLTTNGLIGQIGLELEIEGARLPREGHLETVVGKTTKCRWRPITDGSLRGEALEYILSTPCVLDELRPVVEGLFKAFEAGKTVLANSNRCSTHVHINVSGKTVNQITSVIALWSTFEDVLIAWCGEERVANHFALSTKDATSLLASWEQYLRNGNGGFSAGLKYSALNILPIWDKGSIEFRTGPAADAPEIPITWATFLYKFCQYAFETFQNPMEIAYALSERGGWDVFSSICGEDLTEFRNAVLAKTDGTEDFNRIAIRGFRNAQSIVLGYPWDQWMELINKEFVPNPFAKKSKEGFRIRMPDHPPMHDDAEVRRPRRGLVEAVREREAELARERNAQRARMAEEFLRPNDWQAFAPQQAPDNFWMEPPRFEPVPAQAAVADAARMAQEMQVQADMQAAARMEEVLRAQQERVAPAPIPARPPRAPRRRRPVEN